MRFAVVDDREEDLEQVASTVVAACDGMGLLCEIDRFSSGEDLLKGYGPGRYDVLVLDILMGGENGIQVAKAPRQRDENVPVIFTTVSRE